MGPGRKTAFILLAVAAGLLRAADSPDLLYKLRLPHSAAKVEWSSAQVGNWEVTVTVDPATCELSCAYRLKRHSVAANLLAPPAVVFRIYSDGVSAPSTVTVDPAGLTSPTACGRACQFRGRAYLPGRRIVAQAPQREWSGLTAVLRPPQVLTEVLPEPASLALLPLRI